MHRSIAIFILLAPLVLSSVHGGRMGNDVDSPRRTFRSVADSQMDAAGMRKIDEPDAEAEDEFVGTVERLHKFKCRSKKTRCGLGYCNAGENVCNRSKCMKKKHKCGEDTCNPGTFVCDPRLCQHKTHRCGRGTCNEGALVCDATKCDLPSHQCGAEYCNMGDFVCAESKCIPKQPCAAGTCGPPGCSQADCRPMKMCKTGCDPSRMVCDLNLCTQKIPCASGCDPTMLVCPHALSQCPAPSQLCLEGGFCNSLAFVCSIEECTGC